MIKFFLICLVVTLPLLSQTAILSAQEKPESIDIGEDPNNIRTRSGDLEGGYNSAPTGASQIGIWDNSQNTELPTEDQKSTNSAK